MVKRIRIATRASKLALIQAHQIGQRLAACTSDLSITVLPMSTKGDRDKTDFLYKSDSIGFFTSEIEKALLENRADIAVHSLKDLPTAVTEGLAVSAIPTRAAVNDVIVAAHPLSSIDDLPKDAVIGTSSLRRMCQLKLMRKDLKCEPLRGNVESRIKKVHDGRLDAIVIAKAGVDRLEMSNEISLVLSPEQLIPAPGQGALAVQTRQNDAEVCALVAQIDDKDARVTAETERHVLTLLHGGCSIPLGVFSWIQANTVHITAVLCSILDTRCIRKSISCDVQQALQAAEAVAKAILDEGGDKILDEIRHQNSTRPHDTI